MALLRGVPEVGRGPLLLAGAQQVPRKAELAGGVTLRGARLPGRDSNRATLCQPSRLVGWRPAATAALRQLAGWNPEDTYLQPARGRLVVARVAEAALRAKGRLQKLRVGLAHAHGTRACSLG